MCTSENVRTTGPNVARVLIIALAIIMPSLAQAQSRDGRLMVGVSSSLGYPDPHLVTAQVDNNITLHTFEGLVALDEKQRPKPQLAASVTVSPDGKAYTFALRRGVRFHDGSVMTSADVLASYERYRRISPGKGVLVNVTALKAPDDAIFVIELAKPQPLFLEMISSPRYQLAILPARDRDTAQGANSAIGTGPYRFVERVPDSHVKLARFDGYVADDSSAGPDGYAGKRTPYLAEITFRVVPEGASRLAGIQSGDLQVADNIPVQSAKRIAADPKVQVIDIIPFSKVITILNSGNPPTDNALVRRAIQAAINNQEIMEIALEGFYRLDNSFLNNTSPYYPDGLTGKRNGSGVEAAKKLLAEAGYKGEPIKIMTTASYAFMQNAMLVVQEQLAAAGMNVKIELVDWQTNVAHRTKGTGGWNITVTGLPAEGPHSYLAVFKEMSHFKSDEVLDETFARLVTAPQFADRKKAWADVEARVADQAYILVNGDRGMKIAATKRLENFKPFYTMRFWDVWLNK